MGCILTNNVFCSEAEMREDFCGKIEVFARLEFFEGRENWRYAQTPGFQTPCDEIFGPLKT